VFGLSFWQAVGATFLGIVVGGLILMPMALFGPINGTNNAVSSGAHFGVVGRVVGSFLSLLTAITFFAISVYTSGDILVGALDELAGTGRPEWLLAIAYGFFAVVVLVICLYGFRFMLAVNKVAVIAATVLYIVGAIAYAPDFSASFGAAPRAARSPRRSSARRCSSWPTRCRSARSSATGRATSRPRRRSAA
jgi:purine-cytosine permease-like protein